MIIMNQNDSKTVYMRHNNFSLFSAVYLETHLDSVDDTISINGKPTAHIPPQLSVSERLSDQASDECHKLKMGNGKAKYSTFQSSYLPKPVSS